MFSSHLPIFVRSKLLFYKIKVHGGRMSEKYMREVEQTD
jgi:hypothetical protein